MDASVSAIVGKGTAALAVTNWLLKGVGFLTILIVLNRLSVSEYGLAELVLTTVPLFSLFLLPGLNSTVIADMGLARGRGDMEEVKGIFSNFFWLQALLSGGIFLMVFFGAHAMAVWFGREDISLLFKIASFGFLTSPLRVTVQTLQSVYLRFGQQSVYTFLEEVWKFFVIATLFFVFHLRAEAVVIAVVLSQVLALATIAPSFFTIDKALWRIRGRRFPLFHLLYFHGKWGILANYLGTLGRNLRPWIIKFFLGTEAVGLFAVVQGLIGHTVSLVPLDRVINPMIPQYVHEKERMYRLIEKAIKYEFLGYVAVSIAAALFAPFFIDWFFPQYKPAVGLFQVMLIMLASTAFDTIFSGAFYAMRAQRNLFFASVYKVILVLILMPPMLYIFGLYGIAYANILVNYLYVWERYLKLKRLMPGFTLSFRYMFTADEYDVLVIRQLRDFGVRLLRPIRLYIRV